MRISPNDQKHYHHVTLDNDLRVLFVQDPATAKSAASLAVNIGHFNDPSNREGLAHFLEHMLFLGTESFPRAGEFQSFISRHGGSNNAWTGTEFTNYFFDIENDWFEEALERFSQFFVFPLFDADLVDKERQAVDSEYHLKLSDDTRRLYQVHKETVNPAHPFSQFSVGSIDTLADLPGQAVRDDLIQFYQEHYSSDIMTLVIISPLSAGSLFPLVSSLFCAVAKRQRQPLSLPPLYLPQQQQLELKIQPHKEVKKLSLSFAFDEINSLYRLKPLSFIGHLIGYEGAGSLIAALRHAGLINSMTAGGGVSGSNFKDFLISFNLTDEGLAQYDTIIEATFGYINLITEQGLQDWRYQEKQQVVERSFLYQEKMRAIDYAAHLALNMHHYPEDDTIFGDYAMDHFDSALIEQCLAKLRVENLRITLVAPDLTTTRQASWYNTAYAVSPIAQERCERWRSARRLQGLSLPPPNPFLNYETQALVDAGQQAAKPQILIEDDGFRLWFSNEPEFAVPKGHIYLSIDSVEAVSSPRNIACTRLVIELMLDHLTEITYQAEIAGMSYQIYAHQGGFTLHTSGFSDKQLLLLKMILSNRGYGHFDPKRFAIIKEQLLKHWQNQTKVKPINQLFNQLSGLLQPNNPPPEVMTQALIDIELGDIPKFISLLYQEIHVEMLAYGNFSRSKILNMANYIRQELAPHSMPSGSTPRQLVSIKEQGNTLYQHHSEQGDTALMIYYQSRTIDPESIALFTLSNHIMTSTFFNELRTKQQLGYIVGTGNLPLNRHPGIIFYVQSPHAHPQLLLDAINEFLDDFPMLMFDLNHAQWEQSKRGLIAQILEPESNMRTRAQRFWVSIGNKDFSFTQRQKVAQCVEDLDRADIVRFMMSLKSKQRDRVVIYSYGAEFENQTPLSTHHLENGQHVQDRSHFHQHSPIYCYGSRVNKNAG